MDASQQAGSNSVTVEYTDPSGLFPLIQPIIETKLPLRNLHWNSPSRPIRSIESLRIGFVPAKHHEGPERKPSSDTNSGATAVAHRRHQIPGLRQTPYLKVYLLRCDDNDTYKGSARKALREWVKNSASTNQSSAATSSQEKHDAFEWLILHVEQDGDVPEKTTTASKWPGRTPTTVLEKVKADFNPSSKSYVDRVAQLRIPKPGTEPTPQKSLELAEQLEEFVEKMKNAILSSFDLRVAQYEEDIKEKDSQRNLPGWNFCTFFILKEGLARGFENVGLYEDALVGYDELAVGLEAAICDQLLEEGDHQAAALPTCSENWRETAQRALQSIDAGNSELQGEGKEGKEKKEEEAGVAEIPEMEPEDFPFNSNKKPYRDMILSNEISIFDFRTYLFSRQLTLLLRAARAPSLTPNETEEGQNSGGKGKRKPEDLMFLSEVCERAMEFIGLAARTLRYDLESGLKNEDNAAKMEVINNLVSSWSYAAASQVLSQTFTPILTIPESPLHATVAETRPDVPKRSSSLLSPPTSRPPRPTSQEIVTSDLHNPIHKAWSSVVQKTGSEQLASGRGQLFFIARRFLEEIAGRCGWTDKWSGLGLLFDKKDVGDGDMKDVSLDDEDKDNSQQSVSLPSPETKTVSPLSCTELPVLVAAFGSKKSYLSLYEALTDQMFRHYISANRTYSAEMAIAEIAVLRFRQGDYAVAASYFHQISPFYGNKHWIILEGAMLEMYARCLKELKRSEDQVRVMLRLLSKFAAQDQSRLSNRQKAQGLSPVFISEKSLVSTYVDELFNASSGLSKEISTPLSDFFADLQVNPATLHYADKDGFQMQLSLRYLLGRKITIDSVKIRLVSASHSQNNEYWVECSGKFVVKSSSTRLLIDSSTTLHGKYLVDRIEIRTGNIIFTMSDGNHSALASDIKEVLDSEEEDKRPYIHCYPPPDGLQARIVPPHLVSLEDMRTLEIELYSGRNDIKTGTIRVRPATAGLRVRVTDTKMVDGEVNFDAKNESGNIEFSQFGPKSFTRFFVPYTIDENHSVLSARLEVVYETVHGRFSYSSIYSIISTLPISVNVQDAFKDSALFSRFTVSPAMMIPLRVLNCSIPSSESYEVQSSIPESTAMDVFPKQPASLLYKIRQRGTKTPGKLSKGSLRLTVDFTCVDDECLDAVQKKLEADIETSKFRQFTALLSLHAVETIRSRLSAADMEAIGLIREVEMPPYQNLQWEDLLNGVNESRDEVRNWLIEWHKKNHVIPLPNQPSIRKKRIIIPLEIPDVQVVQTAELRLRDMPPTSNQLTHAAVGQMIAAELHFKHTRRWCSPESQENPGKPLEFSYEIHANPDSWLVGGRKRGNFIANEGESKTFSIMILPQRPGYLLLPGLDVRTFVPPVTSNEVLTNSDVTATATAAADGTSPPPAQFQKKQIPCEVDYRNHGETLLVLPDLRKTTVTLSPSSGSSGGHPGAGSWLVDSERRSHGHVV